MNRPTSALKKFAELYLVIVGGGYALAFLVGLIANGPDDPFFRDSAVAFLAALSFLVAGIGIYKFQRWGLVLAMIMAVLTAVYSVSQRISMGVWDYHDLTITLPMFAVFVWAILPATWAKFSKRETGTA